MGAFANFDTAGNLLVAQSGAGATRARVRDLGALQYVKATPGTLYGVQIINTTAATQWVQLFDLATGSVTLGTTSPFLEVQVPASSMVQLQLPAIGVAFTTAICWASTTAERGSTTSPAGVEAFVQYM